MPTKRNISLRPATAALVLAGTALAGAAGGTVVAERTEQATPAATLQTPAAAVARSGAHASLADMVEAVGDSVVQVDATGNAQAVETPYGVMRQPGKAAVGSGFIVDRSGIVLTNNHVVDGSARVSVTLSDGSKRQARVLGTDPKTDIAVLKLEGGGNFKPVQWGDSDGIRVGDSVFAVGSPFGLGNTVTSGIVSARGREIGAGPYDNFLQVDAAINSGNSGGPLFDAQGRVVGVNTAMFSPSGGNVGIGFAIPAAMARTVAQQIMTDGSVSRGYIGVGIQDLSPEIAAALGVDDAAGALIAQVDAGGPADRSGLRRGDIVRSFAGKPVEDGRDLARFVADSKAGNSVPVTVVRQGARVNVTLRIGKSASGAA